MSASTVVTLDAEGFCKTLSMSAHNAGSQPTCKSSRLNTKALAEVRALASALATLSGYEPRGTFLLAEANPPRLAQMSAAPGEAKYLISALDCRVDVSNIATSPDPWMSPAYALPEGAGKLNVS